MRLRRTTRPGCGPLHVAPTRRRRWCPPTMPRPSAACRSSRGCRTAAANRWRRRLVRGAVLLVLAGVVYYAVTLFQVWTRRAQRPGARRRRAGGDGCGAVRRHAVAAAGGATRPCRRAVEPAAGAGGGGDRRQPAGGPVHGGERLGRVPRRRVACPPRRSSRRPRRTTATTRWSASATSCAPAASPRCCS